MKLSGLIIDLGLILTLLSVTKGERWIPTLDVPTFCHCHMNPDAQTSWLCCQRRSRMDHQCDEAHRRHAGFKCDRTVFFYLSVPSQKYQSHSLLEENHRHVCISCQQNICAGDAQRENKSHWKQRPRRLQPYDPEHQGGRINVSESQREWNVIQL